MTTSLAAVPGLVPSTLLLVANAVVFVGSVRRYRARRRGRVAVVGQIRDISGFAIQTSLVDYPMPGGWARAHLRRWSNLDGGYGLLRQDGPITVVVDPQRPQSPELSGPGWDLPLAVATGATTAFFVVLGGVWLLGRLPSMM